MLPSSNCKSSQLHLKLYADVKVENVNTKDVKFEIAQGKVSGQTILEKYGVQNHCCFWRQYLWTLQHYGKSITGRDSRRYTWNSTRVWTSRIASQIVDSPACLTLKMYMNFHNVILIVENCFLFETFVRWIYCFHCLYITFFCLLHVTNHVWNKHMKCWHVNIALILRLWIENVLQCQIQSENVNDLHEEEMHVKLILNHWFC